MLSFSDFIKTRNPQNVTFFHPNSGLPDELILKILSCLDIMSLSQMFLSCKRLYVFNQDNQLWKYLCIRDFFNVNIKDENQGYKKTYYENSLKFLNFQPPGKGNSFRLENPPKKWKPIHLLGLGEFVRIYSFVSNKSDSLFQKFVLSGEEDGIISLTLRSIRNIQENRWMEYFKLIFSESELSHLQISSICGLSYTIQTNHPKLIKKLFRLFISFNSLPKEDLVLIRKLVQSENWMKVTPLTDEERKELKDITLKKLFSIKFYPTDHNQSPF